MAILVIIAVIVALRVIAGMMTPDEPEPATPAAVPPPPRKPLRRRMPPRLPEPEAPQLSDEGPDLAAPPLVAKSLPAVAPRRAPTVLFRGRDDLRRAMVLREVLGRPLSLR